MFHRVDFWLKDFEKSFLFWLYLENSLIPKVLKCIEISEHFASSVEFSEKIFLSLYTISETLQKCETSDNLYFLLKEIRSSFH